MGLVHSISSYFYPAQSPHLSQATIKTKSQRLILCIRQTQYRLQQETIKQQQQLVKMMTAQGPVHRSRQAEKIKMELIIRNSEKLLVYDEIIICLNQILNESATLQNAPNKISNQCVVAINSVIFLYERMELYNFVNLKQFIPSPHPTIGIAQTSPLIQKYLNEKEVSFYELNLYACQFAKRNNATIEIFNCIGHNFLAEPVEPNQQSPSAHMFAITLDDVEIEEQLKMQ